MLTYIRRYPLSLFIVAIILYLSFFKPPQTSISEIQNIDKIVHICMYGGLTLILWTEHLLQHKCIIRRHLFIGGIICPIVLSGIIEIGQATLTDTRSGELMDLLANVTGVLLGSIFSYYIIRPWIGKRKSDNNKKG